MSNTTGAALSPDHQPTAFNSIPDAPKIEDAPVSNEVIAELSTPRVLCFVMDAISDAEKRSLPFKEFGGIHLPDLHTLRETNHMLYRCQFTRLPPFVMVGDWNTMLGPSHVHTHDASFVQTVNGQQQVVSGFMGSDTRKDLLADGEFRQRRSNHVVYKKRYAAQDARRAIERHAPHGAGGVVELTSLKGADAATVNAAQLFFFPEWGAIRQGFKQLPITTQAMREYIEGRIAQIASLDAVTQGIYYQIGRDLLRSVSEFQRHALATIRSDETILKDATTRGAAGTVNHSAISDKLLEQTNSKRKEDVLTGQSNDVAELTREMREERKAQNELAAKQLLLEERKQYTAEVTAGLRERDLEEEVRLGMRKAESVPAVPEKAAVITEVFIPGQSSVAAPDDHQPAVSSFSPPPDDAPVVVVPPPAVETDAEAVVGNTEASAPTVEGRICGHPTAAGTPCTRPIKEFQAGCSHHNK